VGPDDFRRIALALEGVVERAHMGHPDFRLNGRIFATLHADNRFGMVQLTPEQQEQFIERYPETFAPEAGAWGRGGSTRVYLASVHDELLGEALTLAWQNAASKGEAKTSKRRSTTKPARRTGKH
jgi:hypothetical protein